MKLKTVVVLNFFIVKVLN